jgi:hypothetical protein
MSPTKERNELKSGTDETSCESKRRETSWGLRPQTPGIYRFLANPSLTNLVAGAQLDTGPSLVLAPESALRLPPGRALSSAPVTRSVFARTIPCKRPNQKRLDYRSAFRHDPLP